MLQQRFPERVKVDIAGYSYEKRPLKFITISNGKELKNKPVIFIDAGMHARDWISVSTALFIINQLVENFESHRHLLENHEWIVMPVVNADGYEYTFSHPSHRMWKKTRKPHGNCFGVDLDRNFDFKFDHSAGDDPCTDSFKGLFPFSEPESKALRNVINDIEEDMLLYLTLRAFGDYLLFPWSFLAHSTGREGVLYEVGKAAGIAIHNHSGKRYVIGNAAHYKFPVPGASIDYAYSRTENHIAYMMMLPGGGEKGYDPPTSSIKPYVEESWIGIVAMASKVIEIHQ